MPFELTRGAPGGAEASHRWCSQDCEILGRLLAITTMLTASKWPDGKKRETSTLTVCFDQEALKIALNDRAQKCSLWASGASLVEALEALEAALQSGNPSWRRWTR